MGIDYKNKLIALCSDGERVLRSNQNGVHGLLKREIPSLLGIHCLSHSFSLATKSDLSQTFPVLDEIFHLAYRTYSYLNESVKRLGKLFEAKAEIEDLIQGLNLIKPTKIRWLSLFNSISRITKLLKPIIQTLKESRDLTAKSLIPYFEDPRILAWIHFLSDIAPDLKFVTTLFQDRNFNMRAAFRILKSMKENLSRKYIDSFRPGHCYSTFLTKFKTLGGTLLFDDFLTYINLLITNLIARSSKNFVQTF